MDLVKAVLFDLDGVLADSFPVVFKNMQTTFKRFGLKPLSRKKFSSSLGLTASGIFSLYSKNKAKAAEMTAFFRGLTTKTISEIKPTAGCAETLSYLSKKYSLALVTSRGHSTFKLIKSIGVKRFFKTIVTADDASNHKPHPEPLLIACRQLGLEPSECVYVGDAREDVLAGKNAGMTTVLVGKKNGFKPDYFVKNLIELKKLF